jgi:hypothetical protein
MQANKDCINSLSDILPLDYPLSPSNFTHVLFLYRACRVYYFGLFKKEECHIDLMSKCRQGNFNTVFGPINTCYA